jgi:UDP-N-acetylglucosamine 2-epimerase (non-hydrolysing)
MELYSEIDKGPVVPGLPVALAPPRQPRQPVKVLTLFGTRPEAIKLAPVIGELEARGDRFRTVNVNSGQHTSLLQPFIDLFSIRIDHDLGVMEPNQSPSGVCARVLTALDPILVSEKPELILVQGDTTTALAGAMAGFHRGIPVGHVEAGLRSGNIQSPFPEEMNRCLISQVASFHFAATEHNRAALLSEGVSDAAIFVTGNPVVDSLQRILAGANEVSEVQATIDQFTGRKLIVLTTHRRESLGRAMEENLEILRAFVENHADVALAFPVHLNPSVRSAAQSVLQGHERIKLLPPLGYPGFLRLLANAWLIVSDSGGVQEEAPSLGKPLLVLRENTERPEALAAGVARLVGGQADNLAQQLNEVYESPEWVDAVREIPNPFGTGDSGARIVDAIENIMAGRLIPDEGVQLVGAVAV